MLFSAALVLAGVWGFAEATFFFIVPDVAVSLVALRFGLRAGIAAAFAAAAGAALGGLAAMLVARADPAFAERALASLPAIDAGMIQRVRGGFAEGGLLAAFAGAFSGVPYKIYAVVAAEAGRSPLAFAAATPLIRLPRFLLTAAITSLVQRRLARRTSERGRLALLLAAWTLFYAVYFSRMP